jgi:hypothetical protein
MDVWDCALGFMDSQILLTAEELGVFDILDRKPAEANEVAEAVHLPLDSAHRLLTALCALGFLRKLEDGRFENGPEASQQLVRGKPGYIGGMFQHLRDDLYPVWRYFRKALEEGEAQWKRAFPEHTSPHERVHTNAEALRAFMHGMHPLTYEAARELTVLSPEVLRIPTIIDIGGASGAFVIALAEAAPHLRGCVYDLPAVRPIAEECIRAAKLSERVWFHEGNFWEEELPAGFHAYSLGFILHDWNQSGQEFILSKTARACPPGSLLILGEYLLNDSRTGPHWVARADLNMLTVARGRERTTSEYKALIARFGFEPVGLYVTSKAKSFILARRSGG